jgi:hypothetical protein
VSGVQLPVYYSPMPTTNAQKQKNERTTIMLNEAKVLSGYKLGNFYEGRKFVTALVVVMCLGLVSASLCDLVNEVREEFDRSKLTDLFGRDTFFPTPAAVMIAYGQRNSVTPLFRGFDLNNMNP